jgi:hypothetical protein
LRAYIDETEEQHVEVTEVEEQLPEPEPEPEPVIVKPEPVIVKPVEPVIVKPVAIEPIRPIEPVRAIEPSKPDSKISFSDSDLMVDLSGITSVVNAPKDEETLAKRVSTMDMGGDDDDDEEGERLSIGDSISLDIMDINDISPPPKINLKAPPVLEFEVLH